MKAKERNFSPQPQKTLKCVLSSVLYVVMSFLLGLISPFPPHPTGNLNTVKYVCQQATHENLRGRAPEILRESQDCTCGRDFRSSFVV